MSDDGPTWEALLTDPDDDRARVATAALAAAAALNRTGDLERVDWLAAGVAELAVPRFGPEWWDSVAGLMHKLREQLGAPGMSPEWHGSWTDPAVAKAEIAARLTLLSTREPLDWTREAMAEALAGAPDDDDAAEDARKCAAVDVGGFLRVGGPAGDLLAREWAGRMAKLARPLRSALFPNDDDDDPRQWGERFAAWLERQSAAWEGPAPAAAAVASAEAADLRALLAQEELPLVAPPRLRPSKLLLTLLRPDARLARLAWAWAVRDWWKGEIKRRPKADTAPDTVPADEPEF